jgi:hypothetical protein
MIGSFTVNTLFIRNCADDPNSATRQENAKALRVAQGSASRRRFTGALLIRAIRPGAPAFVVSFPPSVQRPDKFLCASYAVLCHPILFYTFLCISMRSYTLSMHFLYTFPTSFNLNTCRFLDRYRDRSRCASEISYKLKIERALNLIRVQSVFHPWLHCPIFV